MLHFVTGGARSGKSRFAEDMAKQQEALGKRVYYVATAKSQCKVEGGTVDHEMLQRIEVHQSERPESWVTVETPVELSRVLQELDSKDSCILVDCLTLWTLNILSIHQLTHQKSALLECLPNLQSEVIIVSNEIGMGVIPLGEFTRQYVDELGWLHQEIAKLSGSVFFMVSGIAMPVKTAI